MTENEYIVEDEVYDYGRYSREHGNYGLPGLAQGAGVALDDGVGENTDEHYHKVFHSVIQACCGVLRIALALKIEVYQRTAEEYENKHAYYGQNRTENNLEPERVAHAVIIALAEKLCAEYPCA